MSEIFKVLPFFQPKVSEIEKPLNAAIWQADKPLNESKQYFPLSFKRASDSVKYTLPYEPVINIQGKNIIIKRYPFKQTKKLIGSIKERWNQADYEINIKGFLMGSIMTGNVEDCYPMADFNILKDYFTCGESIQVFCQPLNLLDILEIVIEDFNFPFTKGENVQAYEIKAYSNAPTQILYDIITKQDL